MDLITRDVRIEDAERLVEIYSYYVLNTAVSFEYEVPSAEEFRQRIRKITTKYPYLVCLKDDKIVGYVYAGEYSSRSAYSWTAAMSIYVDKDYRRQGIGTVLLESMEKEVKASGLKHVYLWTYGPINSKFYEKNGYRSFAVFEDYYEVKGYNQVGYRKDL